MAYVRKKYNIATPDLDKPDPDILPLGKAAKYCSVSDTTMMRLIKENILALEQVALYAPLEIKRADLDSEPVSSILKRLKTRGALRLCPSSSPIARLRDNLYLIELVVGRRPASFGSLADLYGVDVSLALLALLTSRTFVSGNLLQKSVLLVSS